MAADGGSGSIPTGTGSKSINTGVSLAGMTWCKVTLQKTGYKDFKGYSFVTGAYQYCYPAPGENLNSSKFFQIKDSSGTIVVEGTHTGFSGNNLVFNLTTNTLGAPLSSALFEWGN